MDANNKSVKNKPIEGNCNGISFSSNLISDIRFTYDEVMLLSNITENAIEHCKEYLEKEDLSEKAKKIITEDLQDFSIIDTKICDYLVANGFEFDKETC